MKSLGNHRQIPHSRRWMFLLIAKSKHRDKSAPGRPMSYWFSNHAIINSVCIKAFPGALLCHSSGPAF